LKKIILSLAVIVLFAAGFRGCLFDITATNDPLAALLNAFFYGNTDGISHSYYVMGGDNGKVYTNLNPVTDIWTERNSTTTSNINDIKSAPIIDTTIVYAVCDNGVIIRSENEGVDWRNINSPTTRNLNSITVLNEDRFFAVGDSGVIIHTSNSGASWTTMNSGVTVKLNSVYYLNNFSIYVAGDKGTLLKSSNSGANWFKLNMEDTLSNLNKVGSLGSWFFGPIVGALSSNGSIYSSTNQNNFFPIPSPTTKGLYDMNFLNASSGFVTGDSGAAFYTTNGGNNWEESFFVNSLTQNRISAATRINDSTFAGIAGNDFIIFSGNESALPVELTAFYASVSFNDVKLIWSTSQETNNAGFDIERSRNNGQWIKTGFVKGAGNVTSQSNYTFTDADVETGNYNYRLKQTDFNGNYEYYDLANEVVIGLPDKFEVKQNYPNPFNPTTNLEFSIPHAGSVSLKIYDMQGREVAVLVNEVKPAGNYKIIFNGSNLSSGVYFYKLELNANGQTLNKVMKMLLTK